MSQIHPAGHERRLSRVDIEDRLKDPSAQRPQNGYAVLDLSHESLEPKIDLSGLVGVYRGMVKLVLRGQDLSGVDLHGNDPTLLELSGAKLHGADLRAEDFWDISPGELHLEGIDWGNYQLKQEQNGEFSEAEKTYRILRQRHQERGLGDIAAKFYYREMECRRKALSWRRQPLAKAWRIFLWQFGGYGERPFLIPLWLLVFVFVVSIIMWLVSLASRGPLFTTSTLVMGPQNSSSEISDFVYFNLVSISSLGYGGWVTRPPDPDFFMKFLGAFESFLGAFAIGLFIAYVARIGTR